MTMNESRCDESPSSRNTFIATMSTRVGVRDAVSMEGSKRAAGAVSSPAHRARSHSTHANSRRHRARLGFGGTQRASRLKPNMRPARQCLGARHDPGAGPRLAADHGASATSRSWCLLTPFWSGSATVQRRLRRAEAGLKAVFLREIFFFGTTVNLFFSWQAPSLVVSRKPRRPNHDHPHQK